MVVNLFFLHTLDKQHFNCLFFLFKIHFLLYCKVKAFFLVARSIKHKHLFRKAPKQVNIEWNLWLIRVLGEIGGFCLLLCFLLKWQLLWFSYTCWVNNAGCWNWHKHWFFLWVSVEGMHLLEEHKRKTQFKLHGSIL